MKHLPFYTALALCALPATGAVINVSPGNTQGWGPYDMRNGGTAAIVGTPTNDSDGSLQLTTSASADKASWGLVWNPTSGSNPFGVTTTLGALSSLGYDWFRDITSANNAVQQPALKILWFNDSNSDGMYTTGESVGQLVYEFTYNNAGAAPEGSWQTVDAMSADMWQWTTGKGDSQDYDTTIPEWAGGFDPGSNGTVLGANTLVYGVLAEAGSGWSGTFTGAVDHLSIGFTGGSTNQYNFVPEPSTGLLSLGALGLVLGRRRRC